MIAFTKDIWYQVRAQCPERLRYQELGRITVHVSYPVEHVVWWNVCADFAQVVFEDEFSILWDI